MLRLPVFGSCSPTTLDALLVELAKPGARLVAGGTDLLPNLKHGLGQPKTFVSTDRVEQLRSLHLDESTGELRIGASVTLAQLAADPQVGKYFPSLAKAAGLVASPLIRNMATIGGNVNLDTRCRYVNQSEFWRSSIGGCLKFGGSVCHVVTQGRSCVAAMSSDCVPVLISLRASLVLMSASGEREIPIANYYGSDGIRHTLRRDDEITTEIVIPFPAPHSLASYSKWTVRKSIDFPLVSIATSFTLSDSTSEATITDSIVCLGVLAAKPKVLRSDSLRGLRFADRSTAEAVGELCYKQGKTLENIPYDAAYRRSMLRVFARRAVLEMHQ